MSDVHEEELRALVREALARHLGRGPQPYPSTMRSLHPSHFVLAVQSANDDGSCLIEPNVPCTHCNYCKSLGH